MSAVGQTHVHQMETVSIQMVPLHVTVPLAMSWILVDRAAQVSASQVHYLQPYRAAWVSKSISVVFMHRYTVCNP